MKDFLASLGGTKNVMCWGILIIATIMLAVGKITADLWGTVILGTAGGYIVGNVSATFANNYTAKTGPPK